MRLPEELRLTRREIAFYGFLACLISFLGFQAEVIHYSGGTLDDYEYIHDGWMISRGYLPYRDFFEHHTPLLMYAFAPLMGYVSDDLSILDITRALTLVLGLACLAVVYAIARRYHGGLGSLLAVMLLLTQHDFVVSVSVARPMTAVLLTWLIALALLLAALERNGGRGLLFAAGLAMGVSFGFKQTALLLFLGLPAAAAAYRLYSAWKSRAAFPWAEAAWDCAVLSAGFLAPIAALAGFFWLRGGLSEFVYYNFVFNAVYNGQNPATRTVELSYVLNDPGFWVLGLSAAALALSAAAARKLDPRRVPLLVASASGLLFVYESSFMWFFRLMPLAAVMAVEGVHTLKDAYRQGSPAAMRMLAAAVLLAALANPLFNASVIHHHVSVGSVTIPRAQQEGILRAVWNITGPDETVFDFNGAYVFRRPAYKYWFFYDFEGGDNMSNIHYADLPQELAKTQPKAAIYKSNHMGRLSVDNVRFVFDNFQPVASTDYWTLMVAGRKIQAAALADGAEEFTLLSSGPYDVVTGVPAAVRVDGADASGTLFLGNGTHRLELDGCPQDVTLRIHVPEGLL
jgi:hypothetical protein